MNRTSAAPVGLTRNTYTQDVFHFNFIRGHARTVASAAFIFLTSLIVRLHGIGAKPYWLDEVTTLHRSSQPLGAILTDSLSFHHLPTYFILVSWFVPFGDGETVLRLPSALFGALACTLIFGIATRLGGLRAGLMAGLLMALSPAQVQYGQEARSYALVTCLIVVGLWGQLDLARNLAAASLQFRAPGASRRAWAIYLLGTVGAVSVLSVALFWWAAANLAAVVLAFRPAAQTRPFLRNWLLVQGLIALLVAPWFVAMYASVHGHMASGLDWVPPLRARDVWSAIASVYLLRISSLISFHLFPQPAPWLGLAVAALSALGVLYLRRQRRDALTVLAVAFLLLPAALLLISVHMPVWMPRYLLWSAAPFFVLAGLGLTRLPGRAQTAGLAVIGLLAAANLAPYYHDDTKPRWDLAAAELHAGLNEQDLLLVDDPTAVSMINLYLGRLGDAAIPPTQWTLDVGTAASHLAGGGKVWAVQGKVGQADKESIASFLNRIAVLGPPAVQLNKGRDVAMLRFDPLPQDVAE